MTGMTVKEWREKEFLPWKKAAGEFLAEREKQVALVREHVGQLEAMVGLLLEGKTRAAVLAWNTIGLHPQLKDIRVAGDGETVTLVAVDGAVQVVRLEEILGELERMANG